MIGRLSDDRSFALAVAGRAILIAALAYLVMQLLLTTHLYATTIVLVGVMALLVGNLIQRITGRAAPGADSPARQPVDLGTWQQQIDYRQTLLDTVASALFVIETDGRASAINRAAQRLAARDIYRLQDVALIGAAGAERLLSLPAGTRQILRLADGRPMFVSVALFRAPGLASRRLIGLQRIAGELDAVEVKAWQDVSRVLAHEMMNSLTPIASLSESLERLLQTQRLAGDQEIGGALEAIRRRSRGLMEFVERYRQVAQLPTPELRDVRIADLLSGIERLMAASLRENDIAFRSDVSPAELACCGDPRLLEQLLINLLRNAIEALAGGTTDRPPCIQVVCRAREEQIEIAVTDNGPGLPSGSEDQIFVPFFTTKSAGSGIGLSVARQIALAHAGRLDVRPHEPQGSAFVLTLPIRTGKVASTASHAVRWQ